MITVSVGPWLKGSDSAELDNAWYQLSGEPTMPLTSGTYDPPAGRSSWSYHLEQREAAYIFGTVKYQNLTPDTDPDDFFVKSPASVAMYDIYLLGSGYLRPADPFSPLDADDISRLFWCINGHCYDSGKPSDTIALPIAPQFDGKNTVGPTPFVAAVPRVFSAEFADGDPGFANYRFFVTCAADTALPPTGGEITTKIGWAHP